MAWTRFCLPLSTTSISVFLLFYRFNQTPFLFLFHHLLARFKQVDIHFKSKQWLVCFLVLNVLEEGGSTQREPYLIHQPLLPMASQGNPLFVCIPPTRILILVYRYFLFSYISPSLYSNIRGDYNWDWLEFLIWDVKQRRILDEGCEDEELGGIVREAKKRLDERLRSQRKSQPKRY